MKQITPTKLQVEVLGLLKRTRMGRNKKGLVVLATALGKTILSALFAKQFNRVLFLVHREEILTQAEEAFEKVSPLRSRSRLDGNIQDLSGEIVFASVQTLKNKKWLKQTDPHDFDLVIVDEFHHAAAPSYLKILKKLKPQFLLGLTATPLRTDRQDIIELCDNNVIINCELFEAFQRGLLDRPNYNGIEDTIKWKHIPWTGGKYDLEMVAKHASTHQRAKRALEEWKRLAGKRTLAFCCNVAHADFMRKYFAKRGVKCSLIHGGTPSDERKQVRADLTDGKIQVLFSIDVFNEGVDVPLIDTVLLLRPTHSELIWLQQIGRGLRKVPGKKPLVVIDFIGNHKKFKAHLKRIVRVFTGEQVESASELREKLLEMPELRDVHLKDLSVLKDWLKQPDRTEQIEEAVRLYVEEKWRMSKIAKKLGKAKGAIRDQLIVAGVYVRKYIDADLRTEVICALQKRLPDKQIAEKFGISLSVVCNLRRREGLVSLHNEAEATAEKKGAALLRKGLSNTQVAEELGVVLGTVKYWRKRADLMPLREEKRTAGLRLLKKGWSDKKIAQKVGVDKSSVCNWRREISMPSILLTARAKTKTAGFRLLKKGLSDAQIAEELKVHQSTVCYWRKKAGIPSPYREKALQSKADVLKLLKEGWFPKQIAEEVEVDRNTVRLWRIEAGIPPPPKR